MDETKKSVRYELGMFFYLLSFFILVGLLITTTIFAYILYIRLILFLKPKNESADGEDQVQPEAQQNDDEFVEQESR